MPDLPVWLAAVFLACVLGWICLIDLREFRIPDAASLSLVVTGLVWNAGSPDAVLGAVFGYAVFAALGAGYYRWRGTDGLGLGDAKLIAGAGAWLGWHALPTLVLIAACSALAFAVAMNRQRLAFGPWIASAFWIVWTSQALG